MSLYFCEDFAELHIELRSLSWHCFAWFSQYVACVFLIYTQIPFRYLLMLYILLNLFCLLWSDLLSLSLLLIAWRFSACMSLLCALGCRIVMGCLHTPLFVASHCFPWLCKLSFGAPCSFEESIARLCESYFICFCSCGIVSSSVGCKISSESSSLWCSCLSWTVWINLSLCDLFNQNVRLRSVSTLTGGFPCECGALWVSSMWVCVTFSVVDSTFQFVGVLIH